MKIVVDGFGGDNAPAAVVAGCALALERDKNIGIVITGKEDILKEEFAKIQNVDMGRIEFVDAPDVISGNEVPTDAIRSKPNSSLVKAITRAKEADCAGLVSAGSTGAVLMGATVFLGRIAGISRPALAPILPTSIQNKKVILCDCGANSECKPQFLVQFAQMAAAYSKTIFGVENPRVGLLSNGTEDKKGIPLTLEAFPLIQEAVPNFAGNIEGRDIMTGELDVVVADGFSGNIALKSLEGTALTVLGKLKESIEGGGLRAKIGYLFLKKSLKKMKKELDYNESGGSAFLGVIKPVIKSHGSSKAKVICNSIFQVKEMHEKDTVGQLAKVLASSTHNA